VSRVRSEISQIVSEPSAVIISAYQGRVTLRGSVPSSEVQPLMETVRAVEGVQGVDNQLRVRENSSDLPGTGA
jgi:osmotically-inducible protein OsmY